jgi:hypothetical protein
MKVNRPPNHKSSSLNRKLLKQALNMHRTNQREVEKNTKLVNMHQGTSPFALTTSEWANSLKQHSLEESGFD